MKLEMIRATANAITAPKENFTPGQGSLELEGKEKQKVVGATTGEMPCVILETRNASVMLTYLFFNKQRRIGGNHFETTIGNHTVVPCLIFLGHAFLQRMNAGPELHAGLQLKVWAFLTEVIAALIELETLLQARFPATVRPRFQEVPEKR